MQKTNFWSNFFTRIISSSYLLFLTYKNLPHFSFTLNSYLKKRVYFEQVTKQNSQNDLCKNVIQSIKSQPIKVYDCSFERSRVELSTDRLKHKIKKKKSTRQWHTQEFVHSNRSRAAFIIKYLRCSITRLLFLFFFLISFSHTEKLQVWYNEK